MLLNHKDHEDVFAGGETGMELECQRGDPELWARGAPIPLDQKHFFPFLLLPKGILQSERCRKTGKGEEEGSWNCLHITAGSEVGSENAGCVDGCGSSRILIYCLSVMCIVEITSPD